MGNWIKLDDKKYDVGDDFTKEVFVKCMADCYESWIPMIVELKDKNTLIFDPSIFQTIEVHVDEN